jgi:hypothetical protein
MIYAINYDLKQPGQDYSGLYEAIKSCGAWWHYLGSTWLVDTGLDAAAIWNRLYSHTDRNDSVLVIGVTRDYSGWLPKDAWEWIKSRRASAAA